LLLMSDSTDSTHPGYQVSESYIGDEMNKIFEKIEGRIIIGTFASQLSRLQKLFDLAKLHGRKIYLQGRSMNNNVDIAHKIGYLNFHPSILMGDSDIKDSLLLSEKILSSEKKWDIKKIEEDQEYLEE